jgi:hypothetical protein
MSPQKKPTLYYESEIRDKILADPKADVWSTRLALIIRVLFGILLIIEAIKTWGCG